MLCMSSLPMIVQQIFSMPSPSWFGVLYFLLNGNIKKNGQQHANKLDMPISGHNIKILWKKKGVKLGNLWFQARGSYTFPFSKKFGGILYLTLSASLFWLQLFFSWYFLWMLEALWMRIINFCTLRKFPIGPKREGFLMQTHIGVKFPIWCTFLWLTYSIKLSIVLFLKSLPNMKSTFQIKPTKNTLSLNILFMNSSLHLQISSILPSWGWTSSDSESNS